ncbi:hypothetical protein Gogos_015239 [Gossypium gossypioides]|uniref:Uncharacterized protein n=1 Tax=Gossypium gossypioides TaxID=34282 RepID=A0A7J9C0Z9_GOSGO|nr:hypothetical protein [Gossypium gossypioides]
MENEMAGLKLDDREEDVMLLPIDPTSQTLAYKFCLAG